jgi:hypothetical protein
MNVVYESTNPSQAVVWPERRAAIRAAGQRAPVIAAVERVEALDAKAFRERARRNVPFVLTGIVDRWPIASLSVADLKKAYGGMFVQARVGDYIGSAFTREREFRAMTLADYLELAQASTDGLPPYAGNQSMPELMALCDWPPYYAHYKKAKVWLGPAGTVTPLHCDFTDNLFAQIWGRKRLRLFPPHHAPFLYTRQANPRLHGSSFDPEAPDYERYPLASRAREVVCEVKAGEMLFIPSGWFHHVRSLELSLSANRWTKDLPMALRP